MGGMDDDALVAKTADAVVRRIDERERINLLAQAVLLRMEELGFVARAPAVQAAERVPPHREGDADGTPGDTTD